MSLLGQRARAAGAEREPAVQAAFSADGVLWTWPAHLELGDLAAREEAAGFVLQLEELGLLEELASGRARLSWPAAYEVLSDEFVPPRSAWPLPPVDAELVPALKSSEGLSSSAFNIAIAGWRRRSGGSAPAMLELTGPVADGVMLGREVFELVEAVRRFQRRPAEARTAERNRLAWGELRAQALSAGAVLDGFLKGTVVLRPRMLRLALERAPVGDDVAVRMTPTFEGAPERWEQHFDRARLSSLYKVVEPDASYVEVVVEDAVKEVLGEIKRLPGRTALGARARQLLENPVAFFGGSERGVLDEAAVEAELARLRDGAHRFVPQAQLDDGRRVTAVGLLVEPVGEHADGESALRLFSTVEGLDAFVGKGRAALADRQAHFGWGGLELEVDVRTEGHLGHLEAVGRAWREGASVQVAIGDDLVAAAQPDPAAYVIAAELVLDLSRYYERIDAIGVETPYGIISIPLSRRGAWLPEDAELRLLRPDDPDGRPVAMDRDELARFMASVEQAEEDGAAEVPLPRGGAMPLRQARDFVAALPQSFRQDVRPDAARASGPGAAPQPRTGLLIKSNVDQDDFVTKREERLRPPPGAVPLLPTNLRAGVSLKAHQRTGLLWLQHLYLLAPGRCHGALLADDMGLGKTLQTLCLISRALEDDPDLPPALVVAPVTLLENWAQEVERFFEAGSLPVRTLYGAELRAHRVAKQDIDERLRQDGLRRFLRPGWHAGAGIVLTTYETLRDYEFSFAEVEWSIVACDEAQRIKNPNALVSRAAKKLRARFCIAATGTPVENNLTDLWSLFDFIQPGLLEPLNRFNRNFRRPIEARTDQELQRLEDLRRLVYPQLLRRTKADVVKDLPRKSFDEPCRTLQMSARQKQLYIATVEAQRTSQTVDRRGTQLLQVIGDLRRVCTDPRSRRELEEPLPPLQEYRRIAPKLDWLLRTLEEIRRVDEKAIIFLERKDVQRLVQRYIAEVFGFAPDVINGETPTGPRADSRQRRIDRFQQRPGFSALILSPVAAGVGLNIQQANHVIHYMRHWNPAKEDQATDRAYRIGQPRDVTVYTPIVSGDGFLAFDERLDQLLEKKRGIASDVLNGSDDLTAADFLDLL